LSVEFRVGGSVISSVISSVGGSVIISIIGSIGGCVGGCFIGSFDLEREVVEEAPWSIGQHGRLHRRVDLLMLLDDDINIVRMGVRF